MCLNDGNEKAYMMNDPAEYLFSNAEDCCRHYFAWSIVKCRKGSVEQFYPDFDGATGGCKSDGKYPGYMRGTDYFFYTLQECCEHYFPWNVEGCTNPELAGDPCSDAHSFDESDYLSGSYYLSPSEVGYYPVCKYFTPFQCNYEILLVCFSSSI